jgi:large subunit ribosomal protein L5
MATEAPPVPRLKERYRTEIAPALRDEFGFANVMQVPGLVKIVVNMGVGEAARDAKLIEGAVRDLSTITGQRPAVARAKKSVAQFKLREGMPIGAHSTLRGDRMWEFLDRLLTIALPRIRDFRGLSDRQFDGHGNYTFGLVEQVMFHEIDPDKVDRQRGMDITVVTTATNDAEGRSLLRRLGFPFRRRWSSSRSGLRSSRSGPTRGVPAAGGRGPSTAGSACAGSASARWRTAANCPASPSPAGNNRERAHRRSRSRGSGGSSPQVSRSGKPR